MCDAEMIASGDSTKNDSKSFAVIFPTDEHGEVE
jgi:hypothetical protein